MARSYNSNKKVMQASALLLATAGTTFAFRGPLVPGRAGAIRQQQVSGRASWTSRPTRAQQAGSELSMGFSIIGTARGDETSLPQDEDADTEARERELKLERKRYTWRLEGTPIDVPYLEGFPPTEDLPTATWAADVANVLVRILLGTIRGAFGLGEIVEALSDPDKAGTVAGRIAALIDDATPAANERPVDIDDYNDLHAFPIKNPESMYDYEEDDAFARQRLQGANCVAIELCSDATRQKLKALDEDELYAGLKAKVDALKDAGKLYVVDHELLKDMEDSPLNEDTPRYLAKGVALFEETDDELLPLAPIGIQLTQGETVAPIFTPADGYNWKIAKACFEAADFIIYEVVTHLGNTHVVMEAPLVAMHRQLPKAHPLHAILAPHLEGTALINWGAQELLMPAGAGVDQLTANHIEDSWAMVKEQTLKRISQDFSPEADFNARGMTAGSFPGRYMYRDYGMKYYAATHTWVQEYLDLYYITEDDFTGDYELKAFVEELSQTGQHTWLNEMADLPDWIEKKEFLVKYLASLIYTGSVLHAAVNFPQQPIASYVPNTPASVYQPIPTDKTSRGFDEYLAYLPPLATATNQVVLTTLLGSVIYTKLGDYGPDQFSDDKVRAPLQKFQEAIDEIEIELVDENASLTSAWKARGKDRKDAANFAYTLLLPDNVPQSINI